MKQVPIYKKVTKNNGLFLMDVRAMAREHINLKFSAKNSSILYSLLIMSCYILQLNPLQIHGLHHTNNSVQYMSSTSKQYRASHRTTPLFSLLRCSCSLTQKGMVGPFNGAHDLLHPIQELVHTLMLVELGRVYFGAKIIEFRLPKTHSAV